MIKIFGYECRRLMGNKIFLGLGVALLLYCQQLLTGKTIWGVANTAPFSSWSFGDYLAGTLPLLCTVELFFLSFFVSKAEHATTVLTQATPVGHVQFYLVRLGAALLGVLFLVCCVVGLGVLFCVLLFGVVPESGGVVVVLTMLPMPILVLGLGWRLGQLHPAWLYCLMAMCFAAPVLPLPLWAEPTGVKFFTEYPKVLGMLDPPFEVSQSFFTGRLLMLLLGVGFLPLWSKQFHCHIGGHTK